METAKEQRTANSTFAIGGVSSSADSLVVAESFVLRIKFSGENPAHRKSANCYMAYWFSCLPIIFINLRFLVYCKCESPSFVAKSF